MPTLLHRLGRFAFRHRRRVLALWLAVIAAVVGCMVAFGGPGKLDDTFSIPGSESQVALDRMKTDFPSSSGTSAQVVFTAPAGQKVTDPGDLAAIRAALAQAKSAPQVAKVIDPVTAQTVSADGSTAIAQVQYEVVQSALQPGSLDALKTAVSVGGQQLPGMDVQVGGAAFGAGASKPGAEDVIGVGVAVVILALTFGSLLAAGLPLLSAIAGVVAAIAGVLSLTGVTAISSTAQSLSLMIGLAVGIDYALFIVSRHRAGLAQGLEPEESAALAVGTAGSAVVFAGLTVVIAMAGLSVVGIPFLTVMGLSAAGAVLIAVLVATTLLPALLGFAGARLRPKPGSRALRRELAVGVPATPPPRAPPRTPGSAGSGWSPAARCSPCSRCWSPSARSPGPRTACAWPCRTTAPRRPPPRSGSPTTRSARSSAPASTARCWSWPTPRRAPTRPRRPTGSRPPSARCPTSRPSATRWPTRRPTPR